MDSLILKRVKNECEYVLKTKSTIRETAKKFNVSKSTVHKDLHERLIEINREKHLLIEEIMKYHIQIRHIRGGEATKKKYKK